MNAQTVADIRAAPAFGKDVPLAVERLFEGGLSYLAAQQREDGAWPVRRAYGSKAAGGTAICTLAFLANGDDPNWGPYANQIQRGLRFVIGQQSPVNGRFQGNRYDFAFSMLLLAEAYGVVDEELLWDDKEEKGGRRSIAEALELAVRGAIVPENKRRLVHTGWYSTTSTATKGETDTSVAGSLLIGLLAARNAGIRVPDHTVDLAIEYLEGKTRENGKVVYESSSYGNSIGRSALVTLCLAVARRKSSPAYAASTAYLRGHLQQEHQRNPLYARYYMAQALFQCDRPAWREWNRMMVSKLSAVRNSNGSIGHSRYGDCYATAMSLLTVAVNYRLLPIYER